MTPTLESSPGLEFLYPPIEPDDSGWLAVGDGHEIWWEVCGNPNGVPVVYLHGGPGSPTKPIHRQFFDPQFYRLVLLHQRGCGESRPLGSIVANTTANLINDLEIVRQHLAIDRWLIAGGSWGTLLGVTYGEKYPERCLGFRLRGVCLGRGLEIDWWFDGTRMLYPDAFEKLRDFLPADERGDLLGAYHRRLIDVDPAIHVPAAEALKFYSGETVHVRPDAAKLAEAKVPELSIPLARFFIHYSANRFFLEEGQVLRDIAAISHLPCMIIHGRYDVTTPLDNAWTLHRAWPQSTIRIIAEGAHDELDPIMARAVFDAHERFKVLLA